MGEMMKYRGRRSLVTGMSLEPGRMYHIEPLDRKYGSEGFWVEVTDGDERCCRPYASPEEFLDSWEGIPQEGRQ